MAKRRAAREARRRRQRARRWPQPVEPLDIRDFEFRVLHLYEYEITFEPIEDPQRSRLPPADRQRIDEAIEQFRLRPAGAVETLEQLVAEFPKLQQLCSFLGVAYEYAGRVNEARRLMCETYRRFPDYLFAAVNYALLCLEVGCYDEVPEVLGDRFDLRALHPHRRRFHVSEYVAFYAAVTEYFYAIGDLDRARSYYRMLSDMAPDDPETRRLRSILRPRPIRQLLARSLRRLKGAPVEARPV